jgi:hypothetical protein
MSGADPAARRLPWWSLDPGANRVPAFLPVTAKGETPDCHSGSHMAVGDAGVACL